MSGLRTGLVQCSRWHDGLHGVSRWFDQFGHGRNHLHGVLRRVELRILFVGHGVSGVHAWICVGGGSVPSDFEHHGVGVGASLAAHVQVRLYF